MSRHAPDCPLHAQGITPGSCAVAVDGERMPSCEGTLKDSPDGPERRIHAIELSRPENYLSVYQSGCNLSCRKCHSWQFSRQAAGEWMSPGDLVEAAVLYDGVVTLREPKERATAWHARDTCRGCGTCVLEGKRGKGCPGVLELHQLRVSAQGIGPARNIVAFTGGDLTCRPEFYRLCARGIKERTDLWVLIETNGYGLTPLHLDLLKEGGVDAFWLDIKAFDPVRHKWLTGTDNERILELPEKILHRGFVLEVLSLYIPGVVEARELGDIAALLAGVDPDIPFTILAFFPAYRMQGFRTPTLEEMLRAYDHARRAGLNRIRLGNVGLFASTPQALALLESRLDPGAW